MKDSISIPWENAREIKAKAIDVIGMHPVTQAVANEFTGDGMIGIQGVSAAREVAVVSRVIL